MLLTIVQAYPVFWAIHFMGLFEQGNDEYPLWIASTWDRSYRFDQQHQATVNLVVYQVYGDLSTSSRRYTGFWRGDAPKARFNFDQNWGSFVNQYNTLRNQGFGIQKPFATPKYHVIRCNLYLNGLRCLHEKSGFR